MTPDEIESRIRAMSPEAAARFAVLCYAENSRFNMQGFVSIQPPDVVADKAAEEARMLIRFRPDLDFLDLLREAEWRGEKMPTEPGWYWEIIAEDEQPRICEIYRSLNGEICKMAMGRGYSFDIHPDAEYFRIAPPAGKDGGN